MHRLRIRDDFTTINGPRYRVYAPNQLHHTNPNPASSACCCLFIGSPVAAGISGGGLSEESTDSGGVVYQRWNHFAVFVRHVSTSTAFYQLQWGRGGNGPVYGQYSQWVGPRNGFGGSVNHSKALSHPARPSPSTIAG